MSQEKKVKENISIRETQFDTSVINYDFEPPNLAVEELEPGLSWVVRNVFTPEECQNLIAEAERYQFDALTAEFRPDYRNSERVVIHCETIANEIYKRIEACVPDTVEIARGDDTLGPCIDGVWDKGFANPLLRIAKYPPGGFFCAHRDGNFMPDFQTRSFFTVLLYLNDEFEGGGTNFIDLEKSHVPNGPAVRLADPAAITHAVKPESGLVLIFWHPLLHEGGLTENGTKYMIRSELVFKRREGTYEEMLEADKRAIVLLEEATDLEMNGEYEAAIEKYKIIMRTSTRVSDYLGL